MKKIVLLVFAIISIKISIAQTVDLFKQFKNLKPRSIGPAGMSGRVTSIDAVNTNPDIIYLGTASGGIWKTENAGAKWQPVFDEQPIQNIGAVAITQSNPSIIWAGTGEGNPRNSINIGEGIYKSLDAGKTWKMMGLQKTRNIHRIIINPNNPDIVYVGAIGNPFGAHAERGVYKTIDGGETWKLILHTNDTSGVGDMVMDPHNPNKLFVNMWQHGRTPWSFTSGGKTSGIYVTYDAGNNFKKLGKDEGLPEGNYGRVGLTISRSQPSRVYALVESNKNGLYKSDDGGAKWELINSTTEVVNNRPFYFQDIACDPLNENRVYLIYQMISLSEDGGKNFKTIIPYAGIHPDHHAFYINPVNPNFIIDGNDGGIGISRDRGKTWVFDEKLPIGQFYHINVDNKLPYNVMGGLQDNGSWHGPAYTWKRGGIKNAYWQSTGGGDGFDVMPHPDNEDWVYSMSQGGSLNRYNIATGEEWSIKPPNPSIKIRQRFNWNAAIAQDPFDKNTIYYGSQFVNKSTNSGAAWEQISDDLTTADTAKIDQKNNGGISIDITGAENYCTIIAIEPSTKQQGVIWVGTDDGNVQLTKDGGKSWTNFRSKIPGMPVGAWVPQIRASKYNAAEAFVVCNDYRRADFKPYIFRTTDYGKTWTKLVDENKVKGYALCMIQDPVEPNLIFVGTEQGLWISFDNGDNFQQFKNEYPSVSTYDLAIQEREADLVIATFGRALYILDNIRPLRKIAANKGKLFTQKLTAFNAPIAYQAKIKNASGIEYSTWGSYEGENRKTGAPISFFINKIAADTGKNKLADTAIIKIYDTNNNQIRQLRAKVDSSSGYNTVFWGLDSKGLRQPKNGRADTALVTEPSGLPVNPGQYKVVITLGKNFTDSTYITVKDDPNSPTDLFIRDAKQKYITQIDKSSVKLIELTERLNDAEEVIKKVESSFVYLDKKDADTLRKQSKIMKDSLKSIREIMDGKKQEKQGYGQVPQVTVSGTLQEARGNVLRKNSMPAAQEDRLITEAELQVAALITKANAFFETKWKAYQQLVEAYPIKLFKEYKPME